MATPEIVTNSKVHDTVMGDRRVSERCTTSAVRISKEIVHSILTEALTMRKISACWVPGFLTVNQRHTRQNMSLVNPNLSETDP